MPVKKPLSQRRTVWIVWLAVSALLGGCGELRDLRHIKQVQDQRINELEAELEKTSAESHAFATRKTAEINALNMRLEAAVEELRKAKAERTERERRLADSDRQSRRDLETAQAELARLREMVKNQTEEIGTKDAEIGSLKAALDKAKADMDQLTEEGKTLNAKLVRAEGEANDLRVKLEAGQAALAQKEGELTEAKKKAEEETARADRLEENARNLDAQVANLQNALKESDTESSKSMESLRKEAMRMRDQIQKVEKGEIIMDADLQKALGLLKAVLKPVSDADFAMVGTDSRGVVIRLAADYLFLEDVLDLDPEVLVTLDKIAEILNQFPAKFVEVQGHTDSQPVLNLPFVDNWGLAAARAEKVVRYLADRTPLDPKRLKGSTCSQYRPLASEEVTKNPKMNRRVEIILTSNP